MSPKLRVRQRAVPVSPGWTVSGTAAQSVRPNGMSLICIRVLPASLARRASASGRVAAGAPPQTTNNQCEQRAQRQHEAAINQKAVAGAEAVGEPAHDRRDEDRAEPLAGLAQPDDRALLVTTDGACLHREDDRLDHPFEPAPRELEQQQ